MLSGGGEPAAADRAFQMIRPASFATGPTANKAHERREERVRDGTGLFPGGPLPRGVPRHAPSAKHPTQASIQVRQRRERSSASERGSKTKGKETTSMDPIRLPFRPACFSFYFLLALACSTVSAPLLSPTCMPSLPHASTFSLPFRYSSLKTGTPPGRNPGLTIRCWCFSPASLMAAMSASLRLNSNTAAFSASRESVTVLGITTCCCGGFCCGNINKGERRIKSGNPYNP